MADAVARPQPPRTLVRAIGLTVIGRGGELALGALGAILTAHLLGPGGKGVYNTALVAAGMVGLLLSFGLRTSVTRLVAAGRMSWREAMATLLVLYGALCAVAVPALALAVVTFHERFFATIPLPVLYLALATVPITLLDTSVGAVLAGQQRLPEATALRALQRLALLIALVALVWWLRQGVVGAMIASVASLLVSVVAGWVLLARLPGGAARVRTDLVGEIIRFGGVLYIGHLAMSLNYRLDALLVFTFLGPVPAGLYAVAVSLAEMSTYLPDTIAAVLFPSVSGDAAGANYRTPRLCRLSTLVLLVCCAGLAALGIPLIRLLFGADFAGAYLALVWLLPGMVTLGVSRIVVSDIVGRGHPQYGTIAAWAAMVVTLGLDFWLIPARGLGWGIVGAAVASSVAYTVSAVILYVAYRRLTGIPIRDLHLIRLAEIREIAHRLRARLRPANPQ